MIVPQVLRPNFQALEQYPESSRNVRFLKSLLLSVLSVAQSTVSNVTKHLTSGHQVEREPSVMNSLSKIAHVTIME